MTDYILAYTSPKAEWQRREAKQAEKQLREESYVKDGVLRWSDNDRVPPGDYIAFAEFLGISFDYEKTLKAKDADSEKFAKEYIEAMRNRSPEEIKEERLEARAAYGPGVELLDVFTGERYRT